MLLSTRLTSYYPCTGKVQVTEQISLASCLDDYFSFDCQVLNVAAGLSSKYSEDDVSILKNYWLKIMTLAAQQNRFEGKCHAIYVKHAIFRGDVAPRNTHYSVEMWLGETRTIPLRCGSEKLALFRWDVARRNTQYSVEMWLGETRTIPLRCGSEKHALFRWDVARRNSHYSVEMWLGETRNIPWRCGSEKHAIFRWDVAPRNTQYSAIYEL